jgi:hypothetical protein
MTKYPILFDVSKINFGKISSNADILTLFKIIFNREFKEDFLNWLASCPTGSNRWYGAFNGDKPIGMYGLLPVEIRIGKHLYNGALCNNVGVVSEFQGRGLFQALGEYALKDGGFPIVVGIPNKKAVKGHKRIGWQSYGSLELLSGEVADKKVEYITYEAFSYILRKEKSYFCIVKNQDFIKWRYSKPGVEYYESFFADNNYIIWKFYKGKKQVLETSNFNLVFELGRVVDIWQFEGSFASQQLKSQGFKPILSNEFILYTNLSIEKDMNKFNFELGDNDVF